MERCIDGAVCDTQRTLTEGDDEDARAGTCFDFHLAIRPRCQSFSCSNDAVVPPQNDDGYVFVGPEFRGVGICRRNACPTCGLNKNSMVVDEAQASINRLKIGNDCAADSVLND